MSLNFHDISTWKFVSDLLLGGALVYFALRFLRSPSLSAHSSRIAELEHALKGLVREADQAGRNLNDQLLKRQSSLEKLLLDLDGAEQRLTPLAAEAASQAETLRRSLSVTPTPAPQPLRAELAAEPAPVAPRRAAPAAAPREEISIPPAAPVFPEPEPPSFEELNAAPALLEPAAPAAPKPVMRARKAAAHAAKNIYGEAIDAAPAPAVEPAIEAARESRPRSAVERYKALSRRVEKEVEAPRAAAAAKPEANPVSQVFKAAEEMLRTGKDLEQIAAATRLPLQQVRILSQLIEREAQVRKNALQIEKVVQPVQLSAEPEPVAAEPAQLPEPEPETETETAAAPVKDPRLGVLGAIRRETQVL